MTDSVISNVSTVEAVEAVEAVGFVYKIECPTGDKVYIGSTTRSLDKRLGGHISSYKIWKSGKCNNTSVYSLFDSYGVENCKVVLLETVEEGTKDKLYAREAYWISQFDCVNKRIPGRSQQVRSRDHYIVNKVKIAQWYQDNKESVKQQRKLYYEQNKEHILLRRIEREKQSQLKELKGIIYDSSRSSLDMDFESQ